MGEIGVLLRIVLVRCFPVMLFRCPSCRGDAEEILANMEG